MVLGVAGSARERFRLTDLDLRFLRATEADFRKADLSGSYLTIAQLPRGRFDSAILMATDFTRACLSDASFASARSSVFGTSFRGADLRRADFAGATFESASFEFSDLRQASLRGAHLRHARLLEADLRQADLRDADLRAADLEGADLRAATFDHADFRGANLSNTNLRRNSREIATARTNECTRYQAEDRVAPSCDRGAP